jgi:hypothetical protein
MRILLFGLNSSYTHTALALHSLGKSIRRFEPKIIEHTINGRYGDFLSDIFRYRPDVLCFSCYIWLFITVDANVITKVKSKLVCKLPRHFKCSNQPMVASVYAAKAVDNELHGMLG